MKDTFEKFSSITVGFHWIIAIAIIGMLTLGIYMEDLPDSPDKGDLYDIHISIGVIVLVVASLRITWRIINKFPIPLSTMPKWQERIAKLAHWVLIIGSVMMPISGLMMNLGGGRSLSVFGYELIAESGVENEFLAGFGHTFHEYGGKLLILFVVLHALGAIKHQFIDKDGTISRMIGRRVKGNSNKV